jgi:hypothetical protein
MLFTDLLNFAGSLDAPTLNVSSSSPITLLLYVDFCPYCPALFPNRWFFLCAATTDYRTIEISDPLEEISDLFGGKSLPEGRKSFCSAFVLFLRT